MQYVMDETDGYRFITKLVDGTKQQAMRVCSEEAIENMSDGSFKLYNKKVMAWRSLVHEHGTPQAIRTIDFLAAACGRSKRHRRRLANPPVC